MDVRRKDGQREAWNEGGMDRRRDGQREGERDGEREGGYMDGQRAVWA